MNDVKEKVVDITIAIISFTIIAMLGFLLVGGPAGCSRFTKTFDSSMSNGLNRTFTVYDYNGKKVFEDSGTLDYVYNDGKWYYDKDDKRTSVSGGIVIVQEV